MARKKGEKREEIEQLLEAGKTKPQILAFTGCDRGYIADIEKRWLAEKRKGQ